MDKLSFTSHATEILTIVVTLLVIIWLWLKYNHSFWKRHNLRYIKPNPIFGNFKDIITLSDNPADYFQKLYNHKDAVNEPVVGLYVFNKPCLLLREPELIKSVLVKDFNKFSNRYSASDPHTDSLGAENLFFAKNPLWKEIRVKLTPVFSSGKMKQMFPLVDEIGRELDSFLCSLPVDPETKTTIQEVKEINALYTTDVIATVAFGIRANSLKNPNGDFRTNGKRIFNFTRLRAFEFSTMFFLPKLVGLLGFKVFSKDTTKFIRNTIKYVMEERIKSGATRNDLIDTLIAFKKMAEAETESKNEKHFILVGDRLIAQAAIFFSAGFETSSSTMSFGLYELSKRLDLQQRLREEIRKFLLKNNGQVTYEMVNEMPYLDMVVKEVLRLYPPMPFLDRECTIGKGEEPYSLMPYANFAIPNGMPVYIPIYALHRDPKYYPNPEVFDPERFSNDSKPHAAFFTYMPFGAGSHSCIGERFGIMQTKVGLINFLRNHCVTPCEKSHPSMKLDPRALIIQSHGGIYCKIVRDPLL